MSILSENIELFKPFIQEEILKSIKDSKDSLAMEQVLWHLFTELFGLLVATAFEMIDGELYDRVYKPQGWRISRRDSRTIYCLFGPVTYKRRRLEMAGKQGFYPLDKKFGFLPSRHYSMGVILRIAQAAQVTQFRNVSHIVKTLTQTDISHQTVSNLSRTAAQMVRKYEAADAAMEQAEKRVPEDGLLAIEGDGIVMKQQADPVTDTKGGQNIELHRIQVYEGVEKNGKRSRLTGYHCFSGTDRKRLVELVKVWVHGRYNLSEITVLSNGDGGAGYNFDDFDNIVEGCKTHYHFRDRYHVNEKVRTRLSFCPRGFIDKFVLELNKSRNVITDMKPYLDTAASYAETEEQAEQVRRLADYLSRNADYIPGIRERGIRTDIHLGAAESDHRRYSYRLKKQGRSWCRIGMDSIGTLITATQNDTLEKALIYCAAGKAYKKMDRQMHKAVVAAVKTNRKAARDAKWHRNARNYRPGCLEGRIGVYGATSTPMGQLAKAIQIY